MTGRCPTCGAELGPWEDDAGCVTCEPPWRPSLADRAISALERSDIALYRWDIRREIRLHDGILVNETSLGTTLASDWRACWAGPGLYGLYRHGLLPGVRDIGTTAGVLIHASGRALTLDEIRFILRFIGYRVTATSIPQALGRVVGTNLFSWTWGSYIGRSESEAHQRATAQAMGLGRRGPTFRAVISRAAEQVDRALEHRAELLGRHTVSGALTPNWTT